MPQIFSGCDWEAALAYLTGRSGGDWKASIADLANRVSHGDVSGAEWRAAVASFGFVGTVASSPTAGQPIGLLLLLTKAS